MRVRILDAATAGITDYPIPLKPKEGLNGPPAVVLKARRNSRIGDLSISLFAVHGNLLAGGPGIFMFCQIYHG
jgi:hypothetical protein